ncbi:MAG: (2Fe-2S)-binding protein [Rhodobacterales bacterium CG15_BIG_FIL_POST_REV_8_21_14_020_59_13]|nr:MAG: (2Fe-2S)-binding protein [Rhodobacterales bacterium CG15_BIG_FIL_POST_REV_8_21_14_020_59_13]
MGSREYHIGANDPVRPLEEARALDPSFYLGQATLDFDQQHILAPGWQIIAPAALVAAPGDHVVREIGGKPVLIVRNAQGVLNGFFNVCRHRAGPIALCDGKDAKRLRCAYHGWIYDLDGQLKVTPQMDGAKDFDISGIRLAPIEVAEWCGLVFARAGSGPAFDAFIADIAPFCAPDHIAKMRWSHSRTYDVAANWKVYLDNYLEGYHVPVVHDGLNAILDYGDYRIDLSHWASVQRSPMDDAGLYGTGEARYVTLWPNSMLNILPGRLQTNRVVATGPDSCAVEFSYYYLPGEEARAEADDAFSTEVQAEDAMICGRVQQGLASGAYTPGRLSPAQEPAVWHFHNLLRRAYGAGKDSA